MLFLLLFLVTIETVVEIDGHGMLLHPPSRNSMWRYGFKNPVNYNDNELYCGGFVQHYQKNGGKCGVCGDNFKDKKPRPHEKGGTYANGIIGATYSVGQEIEVEVKLTTNHWGFMVLKFCNEDTNGEVTQQCFDNNPLMLVDGVGSEYHISKDTKRKDAEFKWKVRLPDGEICTKCVIQWTYFAGNTWGECQDGTGNVGCGEQETFINCADVSVTSLSTHLPTGEGAYNPWVGLYVRAGEYNGIARPQDLPVDPYSSLVPLVVTALACEGTPLYKNISGIDEYCNHACLRYPPRCHTQVCRCFQECDPIGEFASEKDADIYCNQHCLKVPSICPDDKCFCY